MYTKARQQVQENQMIRGRFNAEMNTDTVTGGSRWVTGCWVAGSAYIRRIRCPAVDTM